MNFVKINNMSQQPCKRYSDTDILRYLMGGLTESEIIEFHLHMMECESCHQRVRRVRALEERLGADDFVEAQKGGLRIRDRVRRPLIIVGSTAAAVAMGLLIFQNTDRPTEIDPRYDDAPIYLDSDTVKESPDSAKRDSLNRVKIEELDVIILEDEF